LGFFPGFANSLWRFLLRGSVLKSLCGKRMELLGILRFSPKGMMKNEKLARRRGQVLAQQGVATSRRTAKNPELVGSG
jgi:hypothetical protein